MRRCCVFLATLGVAACSLFTDFGQYAPGVSAAGEAGAPTMDGAPERDADTSDVLDAAGPACGTAGTFCDDFEREFPKGVWTDLVETHPILSIDPSTFASGTRSLKVQIPGSTADGVDGYLKRAPPDTLGAVRRLSIEASVRVDAFPARVIHPFTIKLIGAQAIFVSIALGNGTVTLVEDGSVFAQHPFSDLPKLGWQRWKLTVDVSTSPATASAAIGPATSAHPLTVNVPSGALEAYVGDVYAAPGSEVTYWIDDVRIVTSP